MSTPRPVQLPRRLLLLGTPALIAAAAVLWPEPAHAQGKTKTFECAADLFQES